MSGLADRAEEIAAHLVGHALGAKISKYDTDGRQSAVDFLIEWTSGRRGALEVTLVTRPESAAWQGMAAKEGWRWPAESGWEFRMRAAHMPYRRTRKAALRAIELCDLWNVTTPRQLPPEVLQHHPEIRWMNDVGDLRRTPFSPGVVLLHETRAGFFEAEDADFTTVVEGWLHRPHLPRHIDKLQRAKGVNERHLFLVPVDEVLPMRFFTNDFPAPARSPEGFTMLDGIWVWSNYWHQYLVCRAGLWQWIDFPSKDA
ncbi:hypothetical protein [Tessaracoccus antarcticus]|uniref:hypothetical protein n=1 Tax=Tessaracoccus antarcticus TaxID=2479848 RepID=UPI0011C3F7AD|nr:hypothetical protein [Tessaracoccus antarcticus]